VADIIEGSGGGGALFPLFWVRKKKWQKEKLAGLEKQTCH